MKVDLFVPQMLAFCFCKNERHTNRANISYRRFLCATNKKDLYRYINQAKAIVVGSVGDSFVLVCAVHVLYLHIILLIALCLCVVCAYLCHKQNYCTVILAELLRFVFWQT